MIKINRNDCKYKSFLIVKWALYLLIPMTDKKRNETAVNLSISDLSNNPY